MIKGFKDFLLRGNVVDLAVAFVIGLAFVTVVEALLKGFIDPLIGAIFGKPSLDNVGNFSIGNGQFSIGIILTALLNFILVAAVIYFVVVVPMKAIMDRQARGQAAPDEPPPPDVALLTEIRDLLRARAL
jgi:large conductance mechanosensitive channel